MNLDNHNKPLNMSEGKSAHFYAVLWQSEVLGAVVIVIVADIIVAYTVVNNSGLSVSKRGFQKTEAGQAKNTRNRHFHHASI